MDNSRKTVIIVLPDYLNVRSMREIYDCWEKALRKKPEIIGVDCGNLKFIDSSAIGMLVKFYKHSADENIKLHFFDLDYKLERIFDVTKINKLISIVSRDNFIKEYSLHDTSAALEFYS